MTGPGSHADGAQQPLPAETDVLVVGGGVAGAALAYYLASQGVETTLIERGELNREASGTNAGSMHLQIAIHQLAGAFDARATAERLRNETRLAADGARAWHGLERELDGSLELRVTGGLMVAETEDQLNLLRDKQHIEASAGLDTHVLVGAELRERAPWLSERIIGASLCPLEGHVNPMVAVPLLALRARERGALIRTHAEATRIEPDLRTGGGPFRVATAAGHIRAARVVAAAGAWTAGLARHVRLCLPMSQLGLHVNVTEPRPRLIEPLVQHIGRRLTLKQAARGNFIIGGGWPAVRERAPKRWSTSWESAAGNAAVAVDVVPALARARLLRTWSGVMAWTDDVAPLVGESKRVRGFHVLAAGSSGYTLSPLLARMLAERMTGATPAAPIPSSFSPDRGATRRHPNGAA